MKIIFPVAWILLFGFATLNMWLGNFHSKGGASVPDFVKWQFLIMWVVATVLLIWSCVPLKKVRVDAHNIFISNFAKEIAVPLSDIRDVTENRWINIHPVTIHFKQSTEFGAQITFMPTTRVFGFGSSHPVVQELKLLSKGGSNSDIL